MMIIFLIVTDTKYGTIIACDMNLMSRLFFAAAMASLSVAEVKNAITTKPKRSHSTYK